MPNSQSSPKQTKLGSVEKELNRLHRRRLAMNQLIRALEEYLMVSGTDEVAPAAKTRKPNLRVIHARHFRTLLA